MGISVSRYKEPLAVALLLLFFFLQACGIAWNKSNVWDEPFHILGGHAYLQEGLDYLTPVHHPLFGYILVAWLPHLLVEPDFDPSVQWEDAPDSNFFSYSLAFLFDNNLDAQEFLFLNRLSIVLLGVLLGICLFRWSRELWGFRGGLVSLFFYTFSPNILAHSSLATSDLSVTAFFFISLYCLYRLATGKGSLLPFAVCGFVLALTLMTKPTAILLLPFVFIALFARWGRGEPLRTSLGILLLSVSLYATIWGVYGFRYHSPSPWYPGLNWDGLSVNSFMTLFGFLREWRLFPESFLYSIATTLQGSYEGRPSFLVGEYSVDGWLYYFLVAFLLKTTLPVILLLVFSLFLVLKDKTHRFLWFAVATPAFFFFLVLSFQRNDLGLRYILPIYPLIFLLLGYLAQVRLTDLKEMRVARPLFFLLCGWHFLAAMLTYPNQLAYFNELVRGSGNGYMYLVDSNLDWGQDLPGLKKFMDERGIRKIKLGYFGFSRPEYYGIDYEYLPSYIMKPSPGTEGSIKLEGYFAVSATMLQGVYLSNHNFYQYLKDKEPIAKIGYSIFVYRF